MVWMAWVRVCWYWYGMGKGMDIGYDEYGYERR